MDQKNSHFFIYLNAQTIEDNLNILELITHIYIYRVLDRNSDRFLREEKVGRENLLRRPLKPLLSFYVFPNRSNLDLFISHQLLEFSKNKQYPSPFAKIQDKAEVRRQQETSAHK